MEEDNFPRGGVVKRESHQDIKKNSEDKDLFQTEENGSTAERGRKRKKNERKDKTKDAKKHKKQKVTPKSISFNTAEIQQLSVKITTTDMLVLGCVKEVHEFDMILSLANGVTGIVPITDISDAYHDQLRLLASHGEEEGMEDLDVHSLHEIFKIGTVLPCKVMNVAKTKKGNSSMKLSVNPKHVNQAFEPSSIRDGVVLFGSVASQEDHGYVVDLGVKSVRAFLKNYDAERYIQVFNDGYPLMVGQSIMCKIETGKDKLAMLSGESRTVAITIDPNKLSSTELNDGMEIPFRSLIPGMKITVTVDKATEEGVTVKFLQYKASIHRSHLSMTPEKAIKTRQIKACILYIHPSTKAVVMTALPHLVEYKGVPCTGLFGQMIAEHIVEDAEVIKKWKESVLFKLPGDIKAICGKKNLSDGNITDMDTTYKKGSIHRCRVMDLNYIDSQVSITLKQSILNQKYRTIDDVKPGALVECRVRSLVETGVAVILSQTIKGIIPNMHLANSTFKSRDTKEFTEGKQLKCRVLKVDKRKHNVILTHKKMLLNTKLPILTEFDQLRSGLEVEGFIAQISQNGVLVAFYNEMKGWVPKKCLSTEHIEYPEKVFFLGQVVKARVLSWSEEDKKIILSFIIDTKHSFGTKEDQSMDGMKIGEIFECEVLAKTETGLDVILPSKQSGFLPTKHLTDSMETSDSLLNTYNKGDVIENVMFLRKINIPIMTLRKSIVDYGCEQQVVTSIEDIQLGMMIPGTVKDIMPYGVFIQLFGGLVGLAPNKFALDSKLEDLNEVYKPGQSVVTKVTQVDKVKNRFLVSLRMHDCYHGDADIGIDLLMTYLTEMNLILSKVKLNKGKKSKLGDIKVGEIYNFVIEDSSSDGIVGHIDNNVRGICDKDHIDEEEYGVGRKLKCVVLSVDVENKCVEVTLSEHVVKAVKNRKQDKINKAEEGMSVEGEIILIKKDCILVLLKGQTDGTIAYLPSRRHLNDVMEVHQYQVGQTYTMIVKRIVDEHVLCSLKIHDKQEGGKSSMMPSKDQLKLGDIVTVSIKKICQHQLNVACKHLNGRIHITEIVDDIQDGTNLLSRYKLQQTLKARVIGFREWQSEKKKTLTTKTAQFVEFSIKPSKLEKKRMKNHEQKFEKGQRVIGYVVKHGKMSLWLQVTPSVTGIVKLLNLSNDPEVLKNRKEHFCMNNGYNATVIDVLKDGTLLLTFVEEKQTTSSLTTGVICNGLISNIKKQTGLVILLPDGGKGLIGLTDIADEYKDNPTSHFKIGQCIDCYVVSCKKKNKCHLSLRKSRSSKCTVVDQAIDDKKSLSVGQILRGFIVHCTKSQLLVSFGHNVTVRVPCHQVSDYCVDDFEAVFPVGKVVTTKVLSISGKAINLSLREKDTGAKEIISEELKAKKRKASNMVKDEKKKKINDDNKIGDKTDNIEQKSKDSRKRKILNSDSANISIDMSKKVKVTSDSDSGIDDVDPEKLDKGKKKSNEVKPSLNVKLGWCWDTEYKTPVISKTSQSDSEEDDDEEDSKTETVQTKGDPQKDKQEEEKKLYKFEQHQLVGDIDPGVAEDFDRLTLQSPDSSLVWLRYMAFHLETAEIEKARAVAERALKTISFREEQEKMNVWVAYLNLENMYGTPEELANVLERALQQNEALTIYQHLINIYSKSGKFQEAENTYNIMTRKFSHKKWPWIGYGLFHFKNGNFEAARKILPRCLKSLSKGNHIETIAKFAQMEFKHGEPERGKTMFENILSNYPKRTDLWSVYVDMVIKTDDIEAVRLLLNRVIHMRLSAKKMKFFFKKFLDFEKSHGDDKHIEYVKKKAFEYVESKGFVDE